MLLAPPARLVPGRGLGPAPRPASRAARPAPPRPSRPPHPGPPPRPSPRPHRHRPLRGASRVGLVRVGVVRVGSRVVRVGVGAGAGQVLGAGRAVPVPSRRRARRRRGRCRGRWRGRGVWCRPGRCRRRRVGVAGLPGQPQGVQERGQPPLPGGPGAGLRAGLAQRLGQGLHGLPHRHRVGGRAAGEQGGQPVGVPVHPDVGAVTLRGPPLAGGRLGSQRQHQGPRPGPQPPRRITARGRQQPLHRDLGQVPPVRPDHPVQHRHRLGDRPPLRPGDPRLADRGAQARPAAQQPRRLVQAPPRGHRRQPQRRGHLIDQPRVPQLPRREPPANRPRLRLGLRGGPGRGDRVGHRQHRLTGPRRRPARQGLPRLQERHPARPRQPRHVHPRQHHPQLRARRQRLPGPPAPRGHVHPRIRHTNKHTTTPRQRRPVAPPPDRPPRITPAPTLVTWDLPAHAARFGRGAGRGQALSELLWRSARVVFDEDPKHLDMTTWTTWLAGLAVCAGLRVHLLVVRCGRGSAGT